MPGVRTLFITAVAVVSVAASCASASAATYHVSPSGSAPIGSGCPQGGECSLTTVLAAVGAGDTVLLAAGDYTTASQINLAGDNITMIGAGAAATRIQSTNTALYPAYVNGNGTSISDLEIVGAAASPVATLFVWNGTIRRVIARSSNAGSPACGFLGDPLAVFDSTLCAATGLGTAGIALAAGSGQSSNAEIKNSTLVGTGASSRGIYLYGSSASVVVVSIENSIASGTINDIRTNFASTGVLAVGAGHSNYDAIEESGESSGIGAPGSGSNQIAEPIFGDATAFRPTAASPTVDAGALDGSSSATDLLGAPRSQGSAPDIGAYEYSPPAPPSPADTTAPVVRFVKRPKSGTSKRARASFTASEAATFFCKLDKSAWKRCTSPWKKTVKTGRHKLQIKATDAAGNTSAVKSAKWTVKKKR